MYLVSGWCLKLFWSQPEGSAGRLLNPQIWRQLRIPKWILAFGIEEIIDSKKNTARAKMTALPERRANKSIFKFETQ